MKFLLWQFFVYALVSMAVGVALATVWARSTRAALQRAFVRAQRIAETESATVARLRLERASDAALAEESRELATKLVDLRSALRLLEVEIQANEVVRAEAERARLAAEQRLSEERGYASRAQVAEMEAARLRSELDLAVSQTRQLRAQTAGHIAALQIERDTVRDALQRLQKSHDHLVVSDRARETVALLRAERAETLLSVRSAEQDRLLRELAMLRATIPQSAVPLRNVTIDLSSGIDAFIELQADTEVDATNEESANVASGSMH